MLEPSTGFIRKVTIFDILKPVFSFLFFLAEDVDTLPTRQMWIRQEAVLLEHTYGCAVAMTKLTGSGVSMIDMSCQSGGRARTRASREDQE
jgi:hypothetical protein